MIPLQLLGYYVSVAKGLDVDKPRSDIERSNLWTKNYLTTIFFRKLFPNYLHPINLCKDILVPSAGGWLFASRSPTYVSEEESGVVPLPYRSVW